MPHEDIEVMWKPLCMTARLNFNEMHLWGKTSIRNIPKRRKFLPFVFKYWFNTAPWFLSKYHGKIGKFTDESYRRSGPGQSSQPQLVSPASADGGKTCSVGGPAPLQEARHEELLETELPYSSTRSNRACYFSWCLALGRTLMCL